MCFDGLLGDLWFYEVVSNFYLLMFEGVKDLIFFMFFLFEIKKLIFLFLFVDFEWIFELFLFK